MYYGRIHLLNTFICLCSVLPASYCTTSHLLKMDCDYFPIFNEPRALLHLHFTEQLSVNHRCLSLQTDSQRTPLYVHNHILPFHTKVHIEWNYELLETTAKCHIEPVMSGIFVTHRVNKLIGFK